MEERKEQTRMGHRSRCRSDFNRCKSDIPGGTCTPGVQVFGPDIPRIPTIEDYSFMNQRLMFGSPTRIGVMFNQQRMLEVQQNLYPYIPEMPRFEMPRYTAPPVYAPPPVKIDVQPMHIYEPPVYIPPIPKY